MYPGSPPGQTPSEPPIDNNGCHLGPGGLHADRGHGSRFDPLRDTEGCPAGNDTALVATALTLAPELHLPGQLA
jgi:hypothetical protein